MQVYIDVDDVREGLRKMLEDKKLTNPITDIGQVFNGGIALAIMSVDAYLLQLKGQEQVYQEGTADD